MHFNGMLLWEIRNFKLYIIVEKKAFDLILISEKVICYAFLVIQASIPNP